MKPSIKFAVVGTAVIVALTIALISPIDGQPAYQALGTEGLTLLAAIVVGVVMMSSSALFPKGSNSSVLIPLIGGLLLGAILGGVPAIIYMLFTEPEALSVYQIIAALGVMIVVEVGVLVWIVLRNRLSI